jgi:hypothetical protein
MIDHLNFRPGVLRAVGLGACLFLYGASEFLFQPQARAQQKATPKQSEVDAAQMDLQTLSARLPDQAHAMADVGYHFANLWLAAEKQNWPLASYYLGETRSHLRWAVRIHPVRETKAGAVDLNGILEAVDNSLLSEVDKAITNKDIARFEAVYRQTLVV